MYKLIDGKKISQDIKDEIKLEVESLKKEFFETPGLAVVLVGEDPASKVYVNSKEKNCLNLGFHSEKHVLEKDANEEELLTLIGKLNRDDKIDGILVQLPLPKHINEQKIIEAIDPKKDVDGFHPENIGKLTIGLDEGFKSCTPYGIMELLKRSDVEISGKDAVVIGRSNIVGKPISLMLLKESATVTICHSRTKNLKDVVKRADIIIAAVGIANFVKEDMVKEGAVIIDVGINRVEGTKKLFGDVDFENVKEKTSLITPVPGGVGPMTIAMLMQNTLFSFKQRIGK